MVAAGIPVILVREDTSTEDLAGIAAAEGIVTALGGRTSHASVVARQLGKVCLVGCRDLRIELDRRRCRFGERLLSEGDYVSLDGDSGHIFQGSLDVARDRPSAEIERVARWCRDAT